MSKVLRRDEVIAESRWQPPTVDLPEPAPEPIDIEQVAGEVLLRAEMAAAEMIANARQDADAIVAMARDEGYREGQSRADEENLARVAELTDLAAEINRERDAFFNRCEPELVRLAVVIAEKVLAQQIAVQPETVVELTRTHIKRIREREALTIRANPDDLPLLLQARPSYMSEIDGVREILLEEDRRVARGGVIIESASGTFDARFSTQLQVIREALENPVDEKDEHEND